MENRLEILKKWKKPKISLWETKQRRYIEVPSKQISKKIELRFCLCKYCSCTCSGVYRVPPTCSQLTQTSLIFLYYYRWAITTKNGCSLPESELMQSAIHFYTKILFKQTSIIFLTSVDISEISNINMPSIKSLQLKIDNIVFNHSENYACNFKLIISKYVIWIRVVSF